MTSRNLFFKLMKEDFKRRLWVVTLIGLAGFFAYPVAAAFMAGTIDNYSGPYEQALRIYTEELEELLAFSNAMTCFGMVVASLICGLSSFSYLNSRSKVDFYHGIPVRREKLYLANYLGGILYLAVPYGICQVLAVIVGMSNGASGSVLWPVAVEGYFLHLIYFILMYTVTVIAAMMTGNLVVGLLGTGVFNFIVPLASALVHGYFQTFYHSFLYVAGENGRFYEWSIRVSPLMAYLSQIEVYDSVLPLAVLPGALGALGVSLVLAVIGCLLYKVRPSEAAGRAMAFAISRPIIRIILALVSGMGAGAFFWSIRESMGWAVFGILCGTVICHCVVEIIYHFDFKKLFSNRLQLVGCIVAVMAVFCVFRYDLTGYDRWVPSAGSVKETGIYLDRVSQWVSYGNLVRNEADEWYWEPEDAQGLVLRQMHYQDTENVLEIAREGVRQIEESREAKKGGISRASLVPEINHSAPAAPAVSMIGGADGPTAVFIAGKVGDEAGEAAEAIRPETWSRIWIRYTLNNGRRVYRSYYICLEHVLPQVERMIADEAYQSAVYPIMNRNGEDVAAVRYREGEETVCLTELTPQQRAELLAAYQKEFGAMTLTRMYGEAPMGLIRFTSEDEEQGLQWIHRAENAKDNFYDSYSSGRYRYSRYGVWSRDYYPVYPSFSNTLALLREFQVDAGNYINASGITSIQVEKDYYDEDNQWNDSWRMLFMGQDEIQELLKVVEDSDLMYYNPCYQAEEYYRGTVNYVTDGQGNSRGVLFPRGRVPDFVDEQLDLMKEEEPAQ